MHAAVDRPVHARCTLGHGPPPASRRHPDSPAGRLHRAYNGPDLLDAIAAVEELRADLDAHQHQLVLRARLGKVTWEAIGAALGTSRQGAFNRYGAAQ